MAAPEVALYPWQQLDAIPREVVRRHRACTNALASAIDLQVLAESLPEVLQLEDLQIAASSPCDSPTRPPSLGVDVELTTLSGDLRLSLSIQPGLVTKVLNAILKREPGAQDPRQALDPRVQGFVAGLVLELCSRCASGLPLTLLSDGVFLDAVSSSDARTPSDWGVLTHLALSTDRETFGCSLWIQSRGLNIVGKDPRGDRLDGSRRRRLPLDRLPVGLRLCVGLGVAERAELEALGPGDVWLPGSGLWLSATAKGPPLGKGALAAPAGEHGVEVELSERGVVYRGHAVPLPLEVTMSDPNDQSDSVTRVPSSGPGRETSRGGPALTSRGPDGLNDTVLDSPVVVRLELGQITLQAREWAELRPGDILETSRPVGATVSLRVAGQEVGEGQLVNVDGQLGVRLSKVTR